MGQDIFIFRVTPGESGTRLDVFLAARQEGLSRSRLRELLDRGLVSVGGKQAKASYRVKGGEEVSLEVPPPRETAVQPEDIPLDIVFEDRDIIVINKPVGMVVHPAAGHSRGTLVNALLYHCRDLSGIGGERRPGIVHRLDKDTSGLLVAAKNDEAHQSLAAQLKERTMQRVYYALVHGMIQEGGATIEAPIGRHPRDRKKMAVTRGREAVTSFTVLERAPGYTFLRLELKTGRTHQVRVHLAFIGYPVVGDQVYGPARSRAGLPGQALHAGNLGFSHPATGQSLVLKAPLPGFFHDLLEALGFSGKDRV